MTITTESSRHLLNNCSSELPPILKYLLKPRRGSKRRAEKTFPERPLTVCCQLLSSGQCGALRCLQVPFIFQTYWLIAEINVARSNEAFATARRPFPGCRATAAGARCPLQRAQDTALHALATGQGLRKPEWRQQLPGCWVEADIQQSQARLFFFFLSPNQARKLQHFTDILMTDFFCSAILDPKAVSPHGAQYNLRRVVAPLCFKPPRLPGASEEPGG